jgi:hypothetical protein
MREWDSIAMILRRTIHFVTKRLSVVACSHQNAGEKCKLPKSTIAIPSMRVSFQSKFETSVR